MLSSLKAAWAGLSLLFLVSLMPGQCQSPGLEDFSGGTPTTMALCGTGNAGTFPAGWSNGAINTTDWRVFRGATPTAGTGPAGDHTTGAGNYVYVEASNCSGLAVLQSPCYDASGVQVPTVSFWYHMYGANVGTLNVQELSAAGTWDTVWSVSGDQGDAWRLGVVGVTPVGGSVRFRFFYALGPSFLGDCGLDDIAFGEPITGGNCIAPGVEKFDNVPVASSLICGAGLGGVLPLGWANQGADLDWLVNAGVTPSGGTGPSGDHTSGSGQYIYTEVTGCSVGAEGILTTPCWSAVGVEVPMIEFWYHMYGADMGTLELQQTDGLGGWVTLWTASGDQGNQWRQAAALTTPMGGVVQARFRYVRGDDFAGDCALDDIRFGEPSPGPWEINRAGARLDIDGVLGTTLGAAVLEKCAAESVLLSLDSTSVGLPFDVCLSSDPVVPAGGPGALTTPNGQHVNLDLGAPVGFLYGGGSPNVTIPFPGPLSLPFSILPMAGTFSMQMYAVDPAHADAISFSQATQLEVLVPSSVAGPTLDEEITTVPLGRLPLCGPPAVFFYGTAFTEINVHSNGRVSFGATPVLDFTASPGEALTQAPFVGFWTDLDASVGTVAVSSPDQVRVSVTFTGISYYSEPGTTFTFAVELDGATGGISLSGLASIAPNPITNGLPTGGDRQFLGLSGGNLIGATDPGPVTFSAWTSGFVTGTDMLYDFYDHLSGGRVLVPSLIGELDGIVFLPTGSGYAWTGY